MPTHLELQLSTLLSYIALPAYNCACERRLGQASAHLIDIQPHRLARSQRTYNVPPMNNEEAALLPPMIELSFYNAIEEKQRNMLQPSWEAFGNPEAALAPDKIPQVHVVVVTENPPMDIRDHLEERHIDEEAKGAMKQLGGEEIATLVKELWDSIIRALNHNAQSGIRSVVNIVVKHVMLDVLGKEVIRETLHAHISKLLHTNAVSDGSRRSS